MQLQAEPGVGGFRAGISRARPLIAFQGSNNISDNTYKNVLYTELCAKCFFLRYLFKTHPNWEIVVVITLDKCLI